MGILLEGNVETIRKEIQRGGRGQKGNREMERRRGLLKKSYSQELSPASGQSSYPYPDTPHSTFLFPITQITQSYQSTIQTSLIPLLALLMLKAKHSSHHLALEPS